MDASSFTHILSDVVVRIPGAYAAALVDSQGESVDYSGKVDPFEVKLAAAHWRLVLDEVSQSSMGQARRLIVRAESKSFLVCSLPDAYALVILLERRAGFVPATRALAACTHALHLEANWPMPDERSPWFTVSVSCDRRRRPVRVRASGQSAHAVEVLGSVMGLPRRDRGFRVRLDSGIEVTLVREPGGFWYADEPLDRA